MKLHRFCAALAMVAAATLSAPAALHAQPPDSTSLPMLVRWHIVPETPCNGDTVKVRVEWCTNCAHLIRADLTPGEGLGIEIQYVGGYSCDQDTCLYDSTDVLIGRLAAGYHTLAGSLIVHYTDTNGDPQTHTEPIRINFAVLPSCGGPGGPLPFVDEIRVEAANGRPFICEDDSIRVTVLGTFPDNCHRLRKIDVRYRRGGLPPEVVRLLVDDGGCRAGVCVGAPTPWKGEVVLPPHPPSSDFPYVLPVELYVVTCSDSFPPQPDSVAYVPFRVNPCTPPDMQCLIPKLGDGEPGCDITLSPPEHPVDFARLKIQSGVALAGLQGELILYDRRAMNAPYPDSLSIFSIEPIGPAAGMILQWRRTPTGATFVLFAEHGAPIPPMTPNWDDSLGIPILRIGMEATGPRLAPVMRLYAGSMLGSDSTGGGVPVCIPYDLRYRDYSAEICTGRPCDSNADGVSDVRDLIVMLRCLHDPFCMDSTRLDCDHNGHLELADVLCCAIAILRQHEPPGPGAPAHPDVGVALGTPVTEDGIVKVPVHLRGAGGLGGALLQLRYPSDRYELLGVDDPGQLGLIAIHSSDSDDLALGYFDLVNLGIDKSTRATPLGDATFNVRLRRKAGAQSDGELELVDGQFVSSSGERIAVDLAPSSMPLALPDRAAMSAARPNPFNRETRFAVDLPRGANVELTIHDLGGRRVATLFRGALPAGRREFVWNGAGDNGSRAAEGVYFARLVANHETVSRKVVVLRRP